MNSRALFGVRTGRNGRSRLRGLLAQGAAIALAVASLLAAPAPAADPCAPGSNPIVCENSKPGSPWQEWEITGAGEASIQGFATDISVNVGQRIDFKIDTNASAYSIDIYRTGWYQGLGARKIASVQPSATLPQNQPECLTDLTTELTDCGTWAVSASWNVPADAVSGVYFARLTLPGSGDSSHITFIVRDESSTSDVLFQTSDPTWHAYNIYGGSDFYSGADNGRAYKISYNRPFATRGGIEARDFYFGAEYPLVRFLERNGYDVSYFSGVDTDRHGELLTNHKVFLSVGHDEYWSGQQRKNVEAARDAGVNLQFLSGNEVYWRTRYEPSPTNQDAYRTLVSYKETWAHNKIDPATEWTGTWRDPRFASQANGGGLPENALTGTAYVVNSGDLPVTVNAQEGKLRLWRNTPLANQAPGTKTELAPHTVGYESNEDLGNGFRPPGLIHLSTTEGDIPEYLQDFGNTVAAGRTVHNTTMYRAPSGALVFSAGTVQWTWGLDEWHDGDGAPADPRMQQAQVNLLADMDAMPATLMPGLVMPNGVKDTTAPTAKVTQAPASAVANGSKITVSGTASDTGGVVAAVEYSFDGGTTWARATGTTSWSFTAVVTGMGENPLLVRAVDDSANYPAQATQVPLEVTGPYSAFGQEQPVLGDAQDPNGVELGLRFTVTTDGYVSGARFYKSRANTGTHTGTLWNLQGQALATATFTNETAEGWQSVEFDQPVPAGAGDEFVISYLAPNGRYAMESQAFAYRGVNTTPLRVAGGFGVPDAGLYRSGGGFPTSAWDRSHYYVDALFKTSDAIELGAYDYSPVDTANSVPLNTPISATLSKQVDPASVRITLRHAQEQAVAGQTSYDATTRKAVFVPDAALKHDTGYTAVLQANDLAGNPVTKGGSWSFHTVMADPQDYNDCPCGLFTDSTIPSIAAVNDGKPVTLGTRFSTTVDGELTGLEFYRSPGETGPHTGWLYSTTGQVLAEITFPDVSATGWQYAAFAQPVPVKANTEYVAAYRSNGIYPVTPGGLGDPLQVGPMRTTASAGHYTYPTGFPGTRVSSSYLVDVRFEAADPPVGITSRTPAAGVNDVPVDTAISATFTQSLQSGAALEVSTSAGAVAGASQLSADGKTLTFTPDAALPEATVVSVKPVNIVGADTGAAELPAGSFRTVGELAGARTFLGTAQPAQLDPGDTAPVELGMRISTSRDITVHAIRYFQGPQGAGTHTGSLWDATGQLLGTATFAATTEQGWQVAYFAKPIVLAAGSQFTVSYQAPNGGYVYTKHDFDNGRSDGTLSLDGSNGVFSYGSGSQPTSSWNGTNYFADLVYTGEGLDPQPGSSPTGEATKLTVTSSDPQAQADGVANTTEVTATFSEPLQQGSSLAVSIDGQAVAGSVTSESQATVLRFVADAPWPAGKIVTVTPTNIVGVTAGAATLEAWKFRIAAEPAADPAACPCGLFPANLTPSVAAINDGVPLTLGTRFSTTVDGTVTGVEFYRSMGETGPHTAWLYTAGGEQLAELVIPDSGVSGWQYAAFSTPVAIRAGTEYVTAYRSNGIYPATPGALSDPLQLGPVQSPARAGHYTYGTGFPGTTVSSSYLVDIRFKPNPISITERVPAADATGVPLDAAVQVTFSDVPAANTQLQVTVGGAAVEGTWTRSADGRTLRFTPTAPWPESSVVTIDPGQVSGESSPAAELDPWSFQTAGQPAA